MPNNEYNLYDNKGIALDVVLIQTNTTQDVFYPLVPVEDGTSYIDTYVIQPRRFSVIMLCSYDIFTVLEKYKINGETVALDTGTKYHNNLLIESLPEENTSDVYGQLIVNIQLLQYFTTSTVFSKKPPRLAGASGQVTADVGKPAEKDVPIGIITSLFR